MFDSGYDEYFGDVGIDKLFDGIVNHRFLTDSEEMLICYFCERHKAGAGTACKYYTFEVHRLPFKFGFPIGEILMQISAIVNEQG